MIMIQVFHAMIIVVFFFTLLIYCNSFIYPSYPSYPYSSHQYAFPSHRLLTKVKVRLQMMEKGIQNERIEKSEKGIGSRIMLNIRAVLDKSNHTVMEKTNELKVLVKENSKYMNHILAVALIYRCTKNQMDISTIVPLKELLVMFDSPRSRPNWYAYEISQALYGITMMEPTTTNLFEYIIYLTSKLTQCNDIFTGDNIGYSLYGLQKLSIHQPGVLFLIQVLTQKIKLCDSMMTNRDISYSLYGLRRMSSSSIEIRQLVSVLTEIISRSTVTLSGSTIGYGLNSLQSMTCEYPEVLSLVSVLTKKAKESNDLISQQCIGCGLLGLRGMTANSKEIKALLQVLAQKIRESNVIMNEMSINSALHGLRSMTDVEEVRDVLSALTIKINEMPMKKFSPHTLSSMISGLRFMTGKYNETQELVKAISNKIDTSSNFLSIDIGRSLYGLRSMSASSCPEMLPIYDKLAICINRFRGIMNIDDLGLAIHGFRSQSVIETEISKIMTALTLQCKKLKQPMTAVAISMAMTGLHELDSKSDEVKALLQALLPLVPSQFDSQACGNCLFSMRRMSSDSIEVITLLSKFADSINRCDEALSPQEFANAYYGLQNMDSRQPETILVLKALNDKLEEAVTTGEKAEIAKTNLQLTADGIAMSLSGLQTMSSDDSDEINRTLRLLASQVESCHQLFKPMNIASALFGLQGIVSDSLELRYLLDAISVKMRENTEDIYTARDIGYCLCGLSGIRPLLIPEAILVLDELNIKVAASEFKGQPDLLFLQFGKVVRVKSGATSVFNTKTLLYPS